MPTASTAEAESARRAKISAALKGVPKGPRLPCSAETREKQSKVSSLRWASMSQEDREAVGTAISNSLTDSSKVEDLDKKLCKECQHPLLRADFVSDVRNRDGLSAICKECNNQRTKEWALAHPESVRGYKRSRYNIDFEALWEAQKGLCALCTKPMLLTGQKAESVVVDHDHNCCPAGKAASCGKCVRGLLHNFCNRFLGYLEKNPELAQAAEAYLAKKRAK